MSELLVVTDLDGTLLDHDSYSFAPATDALDLLRRRQVPLVLCSSKTRPEMEVLQAALDINAPFICENGAAIYTPGEDEPEALVPPRAVVLAVLNRLREQDGFVFTGFADMTVEDIVDATGLSAEAAALAATRDFSEPLRWEDSEARLQDFHERLAEHELRAQQGGRFLTVAGLTDKGAALTLLRQRYGASATVIALGDSPNDLAMLAAADIAVIIKSARSESLDPQGPARVIRSREPGPAGWQEAMLPLLEEFN
ncbi:MAG: HAD-IIB family hydrolase [Halieaceae bacterium]|nr:HAD-IIB family hydrolase [Halieaceae bacterium]